MSRQANYSFLFNREIVFNQQQVIVHKVRLIRELHPKIGTRKLYHMIKPFLAQNGIGMGRDALFSLLANEKMLVRTRIRKVSTTYSGHWMRKWPNLIKNYRPTAPNQLWVSDITYWKVNESFLYISFITDAYSHKIVGHSLSHNLDMKSARDALKMAIETLETDHSELIHHSDRGVQYYVKLLHKNNVRISMTENGDPRENAIAERLNGIIKNEYLKKYSPKSFEQAMFLFRRSVNLYNQQRPHLSINMETPENIHRTQNKTQRKWKNYFRAKPVNILQD